MWVQVPSSARKTQVERLESFCVIEKIAIDVESLVFESDDSGWIDKINRKLEE